MISVTAWSGLAPLAGPLRFSGPTFSMLRTTFIPLTMFLERLRNLEFLYRSLYNTVRHFLLTSCWLKPSPNVAIFTRTVLLLLRDSLPLCETTPHVYCLITKSSKARGLLINLLSLALSPGPRMTVWTVVTKQVSG